MPGKISPTRVRTAEKCLRLYAFSEVYGREALKPNAQIGAAFGTRFHKDAELWVLDGRVPDPADAKKLAGPGASSEKIASVEEDLQLRQDLLIAAIDSDEIPAPFDTSAKVEHIVSMDGINGRLDLFWNGRLRDYKTTVNAKLYAPTPAELTRDIQPNFYGLAYMKQQGLDALGCTWLYMCRTSRTCTPVYFDLTREGAQARWDSTLETRRKMLEVIDNPPANPLDIEGASNSATCGDYGGCKFREECRMAKEDPMLKFMNRQKIEVNPGPARDDAPSPEEVEEQQAKKPAKKKITKKPAKKKVTKKPAAPSPKEEAASKESATKECCDSSALPNKGKGAFLVIPVGPDTLTVDVIAKLLGM